MRTKRMHTIVRLGAGGAVLLAFLAVVARAPGGSTEANTGVAGDDTGTAGAWHDHGAGALAGASDTVPAGLQGRSVSSFPGPGRTRRGVR